MIAFHIVLQVITVVLVASTMGLALAHALEWPGKMRLDKAQYLAVQPIYYPGFTIGGGAAEVGGMVATLALLLTTARGTVQFWLVTAAFVALLLVHAIFWVMTQPVNKVWLRQTQLSPSAERFFATHTPADDLIARDWTVLRDRWERSHALRAIAAMLALILLVIAVAL